MAPIKKSLCRELLAMALRGFSIAISGRWKSYKHGMATFLFQDLPNFYVVAIGITVQKNEY